jgi:hypothetical protein
MGRGLRHGAKSGNGSPLTVKKWRNLQYCPCNGSQWYRVT